jgi:hypothetical protein
MYVRTANRRDYSIAPGRRFDDRRRGCTASRREQGGRSVRWRSLRARHTTSNAEGIAAIRNSYAVSSALRQPGDFTRCTVTERRGRFRAGTREFDDALPAIRADFVRTTCSSSADHGAIDTTSTIMRECVLSRPGEPVHPCRSVNGRPFRSGATVAEWLNVGFQGGDRRSCPCWRAPIECGRARRPPGSWEQLRAGGGAMERAYARYSNFRVGRPAGADVVEGCNVENASFPAGSCANASRWERRSRGAARVRYWQSLRKRRNHAALRVCRRSSGVRAGTTVLSATLGGARSALVGFSCCLMHSPRP